MLIFIEGLPRHLRLTEAGMMEIGECQYSGNNFHQHSSQHKLVEEAHHVMCDTDSSIIVVDLRSPYNWAYKLPRVSDMAFPVLDDIDSYLQPDGDSIQKLKRKIPGLIR